MTVTPTDAKARVLVLCPDGQVGRLVYVPPPASQRRFKPQVRRVHRGAKAVVDVYGRHRSWLPEELEVVA